MSPFIRQSLSRNVLKALVRSGPLAALDYNKALGNLNALYRSAVGGNANEVLIPLPSEEKPRVKEGELTESPTGILRCRFADIQRNQCTSRTGTETSNDTADIE